MGTPEGVLFEYVPRKSAHANGSSSHISPVRRSETPLQRYSRLCAEMQELACDLSLLGVSVSPLPDSVHVSPPAAPSTQPSAAAAASGSMPPAAPEQTPSAKLVQSVDPLRAEQALLPDVAAALQTLQDNLLSWGSHAISAAAQNKNKNKNTLSGVRGRDALESARAAAFLPEVEVPEPRSAAASSPHAPPSGFISHEEAAELEAHIARLEARLWGDTEDDSGVPLGTRIVALEEKARTADPQVLDSATQQAKIFAAQLQAMPSGGGGADGEEGGFTHAQLDEALDLLLKWDGVRAALPAMVTRMESLAELHAAAAHFKHRLESVEATGAALHRALSQNALVMASLKQSLQQTADVAAAHGSGNASGSASAPPAESASSSGPTPPRERAGSQDSHSSGGSSSSSSSASSSASDKSASDQEDK